jgi:glycosyltransferase involved in cell wall biosynthesis
MKTGISIVIPTFNEEKVIERTLRQFIPFKDRFNLEVVVSDDLSDDSTISIASVYADKAVENEDGKKGRSATLNRGVKESTHDILIFLDADMIIDDKEAFFTEVYDVFGSDPETVGGMMDFHVYPEESSLADWLTHTFWNIVMRTALKLRWGISTPGFQMGRRAVFDMMNGFDEKLRLTQDVDYSLRLSRIGRIHYFKSASLLESPRRYRDEGYVIYGWRSSLRWLSILFRKKSYGEYKIAR